MASSSQLDLPHTHPFSLHLASQLSDPTLCHVPHISSCRLVSPGLVEIILSAGQPEGYGLRTWPLWIGGAGIGDDEVDPRFGGEPRGPVAVRFAVPMILAMPGVDDAGFCGASFWEEGHAPEPTLKSIAAKATSWLEGTSFDGTEIEPKQRWRADQSHTAAKVHVIEAFARALPREESLVGNTRFQREWITPAFQRFLCPVEGTHSARDDRVNWSELVTSLGPGLFAFDLFSDSFCDLLVAQVDGTSLRTTTIGRCHIFTYIHIFRYSDSYIQIFRYIQVYSDIFTSIIAFEATGLPARRPNTMNALGLVINDIGLEPLMSSLLSRLVAPLAAALFPSELICTALDHHHSFIVRYKTPTNDKDKVADGTTGLSMHHDAAEATLNVCLGRESFKGGDLVFCGEVGSAGHRRCQQKVGHVRGRAILHLGRHRHGTFSSNC